MPGDAAEVAAVAATRRRDRSVRPGDGADGRRLRREHRVGAPSVEPRTVPLFESASVPSRNEPVISDSAILDRSERRRLAVGGDGAAITKPPSVLDDHVEALPVDELHRVVADAVVPPTSKTGTMLVWCSRAAERASRAEPRAAHWRRGRIGGGRTLSATRRPSDSCSAS